MKMTPTVRAFPSTLKENLTMNDTNLAALRDLSRLNRQDDKNADQMEDFMRRQADGEQPDPAEFSRLMEKSWAIRNVMLAQSLLHEKPMKTVLTESGR